VRLTTVARRTNRWWSGLLDASCSLWTRSRRRRQFMLLGYWRCWIAAWLARNPKRRGTRSGYQNL